MKRFLLFLLVTLTAVTLYAQTPGHTGGWQGRLVLAQTDSAQRLRTTALAVKRVLVQALTTNAGVISVGVTKSRITAATVDTPIVITSASHGLSDSDKVTINGVLGNTAANGNWTIARVDANRFSLIGSAGNAAFIANYGWWTDISKQAGFEKGTLLYPGGTTTIGIDDLSQVWVIGAASDGVTYRYETNETAGGVYDVGAQPVTATVTGVATQVGNDTTNQRLSRIEDLVNQVKDTLSSRFPASKPRELADTLTRPATGAQAYTAGQAISTSKSAPVIQGWADAMLTAGGSARLVYIKTVADSIANGASIRYDFFSDSIAVNNDGATQTMDVSHAAKWLGFAVVTLRSSTGSTMSWGSTEFTGTEVRSSTRKVWYRMSAENSFTLPLGGKIRSWVKFVYD